MSSQKIIVKKFRKRLRTPVIRGTDEQFKLALKRVRLLLLKLKLILVAD